MAREKETASRAAGKQATRWWHGVVIISSLYMSYFDMGRWDVTNMPHSFTNTGIGASNRRGFVMILGPWIQACVTCGVMALMRWLALFGCFLNRQSASRLFVHGIGWSIKIDCL